MVLLMLAAGCSEAGLLEVDPAQDLFSDGSSDRWIVGDTLAAAAVINGEARVLFVGYGTFSPFIVDCISPALRCRPMAAGCSTYNSTRPKATSC